MSSEYIYRKPLQRQRQSWYRRHFKLVTVLVVALGAGAYVYFLALGNQNAVTASNSQALHSSTPTRTVTSRYFQFKDSAVWKLNKSDSAPGMYIYEVQQKGSLIRRLTVYVNRLPVSLGLAANRVLPVSVTDGSTLQPTAISDPCSKTYTTGAPKSVKEITYNKVLMLCDPDPAQYSVIVGVSGGSYQLKMKRPDGQTAQFVITYQDFEIQPDSASLLNIVKSFTAL
ncbi:MAG TPA: hypothetical protein VFW90_03805 [Candidatus Saccharimonadales bacterium]|nr:hypothetical protein [Candidatus Saccharimonadales bacterium]